MENNTTNFATQNPIPAQASAPAPVQSAASAPVSNKQGGTKKTSTILMIVFLVTTLGFAGAFAWVMLNGSNSGISTDKSDAKCIVTQEQIDNPEEGTVAEVVADFDADSYVRGLIRKVDKKVREYLNELLETKWIPDHYRYGGKLPTDPDWPQEEKQPISLRESSE